MADLIAVQCPNCGSESPFSLATPDRLSCDYCGFVGPLPESARQSLYYAAQVLPQLDVSHRNLTAKHRRALHVDDGAKVVRNIVIGLVVAALFVWDVIMVVAIGTGADVFAFAALALLPTAIMLGAIMVAVRAGRTARAELAGLYAAAAPVRQGAPTRCRVCGAALPLELEKGIVSCAFCGSDNLVLPKILAAVTWHRTRSLEDYKAHIEARAKRAFSAAARGAAIVAVSAVGAPLASLAAVVVALVFHSVVIKGQRVADETIKYVAVRTAGGWCITESTAGGTSSGNRPFTASVLIGHNVHHEGRELKVSGASHEPGLGNVLLLDGLQERPVVGACLVGEPP